MHHSEKTEKVMIVEQTLRTGVVVSTSSRSYKW